MFYLFFGVGVGGWGGWEGGGEVGGGAPEPRRNNAPVEFFVEGPELDERAGWREKSWMEGPEQDGGRRAGWRNQWRDQS